MDEMYQNKEITPSAELYRIIIDKVVENQDSPYNRLMRKTDKIDVDYFDRVNSTGQVIPYGLDFNLRTKIIKIFVRMADELFIRRDLKNNILEKVSQKLELVKEEKGVDECRKIQGELSEELRKYAKDMELGPLFPNFTNNDLVERYDAAQRITLKEKILNNNNNDVMEFHHALKDRTWWDCRALVIDRTRRFLMSLANEIREME